MSNGLVCGTVLCSLGSLSCVNNACVCRPGFYGSLCENHLFASR